VFFRNVDDVHSLLDDIAEQHGVASEITEAISNPVGFSQDVDDVSNIRCCGLCVFKIKICFNDLHELLCQTQSFDSQVNLSICELLRLQSKLKGC